MKHYIKCHTRQLKGGAKKLLSIAMSVLLVITGLINSFVQPTTAHGLPLENTGYVQLGKQIYYGGGHDTFTRVIQANGQNNIAYCIEPQKIGNFSGTYPLTRLNPPSGRTDVVRTLTWFGYGAPGFDKSMWPDTYYDGSPMDDDKYYVLTHIIVADAWNHGGAFFSATSGTSQDFRVWVARYITGYGGADNPYWSQYNPDAAVQKMLAKSSEVPDEDQFDVFELNAGAATQTFSSFAYLPNGKLTLTKKSSNPSITDNNKCYSLKGATFDVFDSQNHKVGTLSTNADGTTNTLELKKGSYTVKETKAPKGYQINTEPKTVQVVPGKTATVDFTDVPGNDPSWAMVQKLDAEGNKGAVGAAKLSGAEFTVKYFDNMDGNTDGIPKKTWVFKTGDDGFVIFNDKDAFVGGDEFYKNNNGDVVMPLGSYAIQETKAPEGYTLSDQKVHKAVVSSDEQGNITWTKLDGWNGRELNKNIADEFDGRGIVDQVKRSDITFIKKDEDAMKPMANVAFLMIAASDADGDGKHEAHVVVTDENGRIDTSAYPSQQRDNQNDYALSDVEVIEKDGKLSVDTSKLVVDSSKLDATHGVWFSGRTDNTTSPKEGLGSLPYDSYTFVELPCEANKDHKLVSFDVVAKPSGMPTKPIDMGTVDDKVVPPPAIKTTLADIDGKKSFEPKTIELIDVVKYSNLIPNKQYTVSGTLHLVGEDGSDGGPIEGATGSTTFTPKEKDGVVKVKFTLDASKLEGKKIVAFEKLEQDGKTVAVHEDISDEDQTIEIFKKTEISIKTTLTAEDGETKKVKPEKIKLYDVVKYSGLTPSKEYKLSGELHLRDDNGKDAGVIEGATGSGTFTPEKADGYVKVAFDLDATKLEGKKIVAFEKLEQDGKTVAVHEDISDEGQTVEVESTKKDLPQLGGGLGAVVAGLVGIGLAAGGFIYMKKPKRTRRAPKF